MSVDVEKLLAPIAGESPCGADLAYDPAYLELERAAQGTPERQVGSTIVAAEDPDWRSLRDTSLELLARSKDLRVVMYLTLGLLKTDALPGFRDGLALVKGMIERHWDGFYPQLSADDGFDPLERMNVLAALLSEDTADPMRFLRRLRETPLCDSRRIGRFSLRDIQVATGQLPGADAATASPQTKASIDAAFKDSDAEELKAVFEAAQQAGQLARDIDALLTDKAGAGRSLDLAPLTKLLGQIAKLMQEYLSQRGLAQAPADDSTADALEAMAGGSGGAAASGEIRSPQDVIAALEKICRYYEKTEPSSPVPLLIRRAQRLVSRNFLEIIQDLTPDAMGQVNLLGGIRPDQPA